MNKTLNIFKILFYIELTIIIILVFLILMNWQSTKKSQVFETLSDNKEYKIQINEIGEAWTLGQSNIEVVISRKEEKQWNTNKYFEIPVWNEGGIDKDNFKVDWQKDGFILRINAKEQTNTSYRVLWEDVFDN